MTTVTATTPQLWANGVSFFLIMSSRHRTGTQAQHGLLQNLVCGAGALVLKTARMGVLGWEGSVE